MLATKRQIFASVGFGVSAFVVAVVLGSVITVSTGIPLAGGLLNGILTTILLTVGLLATRFFGAATVMWLVFSTLAVWTTTLGPPGVYKIAIGLLAGVLWDVVYSLLRKSRAGLYLGAIVGAASIMLSIIAALSFGFGKDPVAALEKYEQAFWVLMAINMIVTVSGVYLGEVVYNGRLAKLSLFKDLRQE